MTIDSIFVQQTEAFVKQQIALLQHDASHDWSHIDRVRNLAIKIAATERADLEIVEVASLLHDIQDWKYSGSEAAAATTVQAYLQQANYDQDKQKAVLAVIQGVGFKDELASGATPNLTAELASVQDADRLDAIGAIGIARCFSFGGKFQRPLYDPAVPPRDKLTKAAYMDTSLQKPTTINHFYEKLLKLQGMMKTETGRKLAQQRHAFMEDFLEQFFQEWDGKA